VKENEESGRSAPLLSTIAQSPPPPFNFLLLRSEGKLTNFQAMRELCRHTTTHSDLQPPPPPPLVSSNNEDLHLFPPPPSPPLILSNNEDPSPTPLDSSNEEDLHPPPPPLVLSNDKDLSPPPPPLVLSDDEDLHPSPPPPSPPLILSNDEDLHPFPPPPLVSSNKEYQAVNLKTQLRGITYLREFSFISQDKYMCLYLQIQAFRRAKDH
jgi:hypothetical protein